MRKYLCVFAILLMAMVAGEPVFAGVSKARTPGKLSLGGSLIHSEASDYATGFYHINKADGSLYPLTLAPEAWATGGGVMKGGVYYCTCLEDIWEGFYYITGFAFDGQTWEQLEAYDLGTDLSFVATDMTYDAVTDKIYGCFYNENADGFEFGTMVYGAEMSVRETIAPLAVGFEAIAAAPDGTLYAVDYEGRLLKVNKATGEGEVIGNTGLVCDCFVSATIDPTTGEMYMTMVDDEGGKLYKIDTATARKSLVCSFANGEEITGLFTFDATVMDVPGLATGLSANFFGGSLTGTVSFTAPSQSIGGESLTGELTYTVTANGQTVATGATTPGAFTTARATMPMPGDYEIAVSLSNAAGSGREVSVKVFVGDDEPTAVRNVKLLYADGLMSLTWDAPAGVHGGYVDPARVRYNVIRVVGGESSAAANALAATSFSEAFAEPESMVSVRYDIKAVYMGKESAAASSNSVLVGSGLGISLPYVEDFESDGITDLLTIIDANNDGQTWRIAERDGNRGARIDCNERMDMDDWLIMPAVKLEAGKSYAISFSATTYNSPYFPERLEVCVGNAATVEAMRSGSQLMEPTELKNLDGSRLGATFVPEADGMYHVGLHGMSDADMFFIIIDDFKVAEGTFDAGPAIPEMVENVSVEEIAEGRVRISWTAPTVDINGRPLDEAPTYKIIDANYQTVVENLAATEYVYDAVEAGEQDIIYYYIGAANEVGYGEFQTSDIIVVGTPYAYPYAESFDNGGVETLFGTERPEGCYADWEVYTDEKAGISDADGTNGFIGMYGYKPGDTSSLYTGKISLAGAERPVLSFYYNALTADNRNTMEVAVREVSYNVGADLVSARQSQWTVLKDFVMDGATENYEWIKVTLPLDAYKGKAIQLMWTPTAVNYEFGLIDGITVDEAIAHDLAAKSITAPAQIGPNEEFTVSVQIANDGMDTAESYTVELYRNGEKIQESEGEAIAGGSRTEVVFKETLGALANEAEYFAEIVYADDENIDNNVTKSVVVMVDVPAFPTVTDLAASQAFTGVELTWSEPDLTNLPLAAVTEDFEGAEPYAQAVDGWTFIDGDKANIGGIQGVTLPFQKASWFVMDYSDPALGASFESHSGTKHLAAIFNLQGERNDDWMISPELCGSAQTISLWAKSYVADYGLEQMELLYSTTDSEPSSFISLKTIDVTAEWTKVTFSVPEGAKRFAIRYTSQDVFMLFVDDVTYIPANASAQQLAINGYNIYRDGMSIGSINYQLSIVNYQYLDTTAAPGLHTYVVTVVYEQGESAPSNEAVIDAVNAITPVNADTSRPGKTYTIDGRPVNTTAAPGLYIKERSGKRMKISVK